MKKIVSWLSFWFIVQCAMSQLENWEIVSPLDFETTLSGSFAEMRRNHFHGGLDLRTEGVENKPVFSIDDGYVSCISISRTGYGKVVFINHPNGYTSVYGHLNGFSPKLDSIVKKEQYSKQRFEVTVNFDSTQCPLKKGEQFALSGNTGASGGPHVHFEIRSTKDYTMRNPLLLNVANTYGIKDDKKPKIFGIKIYGIDNKGIVNNAAEKTCKVFIAKDKSTKVQTGNGINAWGTIGFAVSAKDYMSNVGFSYSPRHLRVFVDNNLISNITIDSFAYKDTRACNSFIDYKQWAKTREFYMKSYRDINSPLRFYEGQPYGTFQISEEKDYNIRYEVEDDFGNKADASFVITGKKYDMPTDTIADSLLIKCSYSSLFERTNFCMVFPQNALYYDVEHRYKCDSTNQYYSEIYRVGSSLDPIHAMCDISIKIKNDTLEDKSKYYITKLNEQNIPNGTAGGSYTNGFIVGKTNTFGRFAVSKDDTPPIIAPVHINQLRAQPYLRFKIYDTQSGIDTYDAYIDGKWVMFEYDLKTQQITYWLDKNQITPFKNHTLKMVIKDYCGNVKEWSNTIYW